jgi:hypothetical protein
MLTIGKFLSYQSVGLGAVLNEPLHDIKVAFGGSQVQSLPAIEVAMIDIDTFRVEALHGFQVTLERGLKEVVLRASRA